MMFVNQHYSLSGSKPLSPAVIELGGVHIRDAKPIDPVSGRKNSLILTITTIFTTFAGY